MLIQFCTNACSIRIGLGTTLSFLGIELDTVALECRLSAEKPARLQEKLAKWRVKNSSKKRKLLLQIGIFITRIQSRSLREIISLQANQLTNSSKTSEAKPRSQGRHQMVGSVLCRVKWCVHDARQISPTQVPVP